MVHSCFIALPKTARYFPVSTFVYYCNIVEILPTFSVQSYFVIKNSELHIDNLSLTVIKK